ncbi:MULTISPECIES: NADPH-dependent FMN reductase [unclassified Gilliamella]|uniref:NADPH-dependent FMN reductase n=1 Tax=unclassified Gilliamella TaxID=2685620 RepID=UPI00081083B4|nr:MULTISPECIES: NAD(P)H-dependent oxidoreductase [Gilliamella]MCX8582293.1 NAD(P)H-dependent oxidoreductase [Gilliamella sp. B3482]MCX8582910.1 NAD(P)H-dependent oxidoreductase [Gilliamella sp. B3372]MCX8586471.1 NAD(P)H-dependent oxidoreductase [Gilliamella sp. B3562]MCX8595441.1 NAD(P)H-dependent oxidoreductase [Gilliamella sp. B3367]MCX8660366.1 NAD(P)H-dependent oxidoreductase [Gilliamella sp. B2772]
MSKKIAVLVGSLRKDSYNLKVAKVFQQIAPSSLSLNIIQIGDLPLYNEDIDTDTPPQSYNRFRQEIANCDGVIFVTPEYNRGLPAVIKNALDVGSRPYGKSVWSKKPAAVVSVSQGAIGGFGANHHLRQSLVFLDMPTLQQPEAYIGNIGTAFDESGNINEKTKSFLSSIIESYAKWVEQLS